MDRQKDSVDNDVEMGQANESSVYVPSLELTAGQPAPIAANGGLSYMSFDCDGDAVDAPIRLRAMAAKRPFGYRSR